MCHAWNRKVGDCLEAMVVNAERFSQPPDVNRLLAENEKSK
jgi:hypothetical protein